ncbi:MAG: sulfite exporter TauE/SafE family protein [Candidatus Kuenenia sp.]|nr:sulfite exporter TauE/SafE family protein [Candidatus Kuenenia hertensis]
MELWKCLIMFPIGIVAGIINTIAGGGSLFTLPILIFIGLPPSIANGTNRLAIAAQNVSAVAGFKYKGISNFKLSILMAVPVLFGTIVGVNIAVEISDVLFKRILAIVMLLVFWLMMWDSIAKKTGCVLFDYSAKKISFFHRIITVAVFFFVGLYCGFIQAGVGLVIIAVLASISSFRLVEINSHKVFIIGVSALFSLLVFIYHNKICWPVGISLAAGNGLGGWLGSYLAVKRGDRLIKTILCVMIIFMAIKLLL